MASGAPLAPVVLAAVLGQFGVATPAGEGGEQPSGVDLGELLRVTDEHELAARSCGVAQQPDDPPAAQHPCLVDDDHAASVERAPAGVEVGEELVRRVGDDPGARLKVSGGPCRQRATRHRVASCMPGGAGGVEGEGLAGAGVPDDQAHGVAAGQVAHRSALLAAERRPRRDRLGDQLSDQLSGRHRARPRTPGEVERLGLDGEHLRCRPAPRRQGDRLLASKELIDTVDDLVKQQAVG
jgi:hypothetical protein